MPFCPNCGTEMQAAARFCRSCGRELSSHAQAVPAQQVAGDMPQILPYRISLTRVLLMTVLSTGLYLLYWFYLTWKQYRDHTGTEAYPIWHALTLFIPIYGLFRAHAHMRSFKELMLKASLPTTISPGWAVVLILISSALGWASFQVSFGGEPTQGISLVILILDLVAIAATAGLLLQVQQNLNRYWSGLTNVTAVSADIGVGEVVFGIIGVLAWIVTVLSLVNPTPWFGV